MDHQELLQLVMDCTGDGLVVVDINGKFLFFNPAAQKILGIGPLEVHVAEWPERYGLFLPDKITRYPANRLPLVRALRGESSDRVEIFVQNEAFSQGKWLSVTCRPLLDKSGRIQGAVAAFRDISERMKQINTFRGFLESAPDATIIVNESGRIAHINAQVVKLFGYKATELIGQSIELLIPERFKTGHVARREGFSASPHSRPMGIGLDLWARRKDGTEFPVEISLSPVETPEGRFVASAIRDITRRREEERKMLALVSELARSNRDLQDFTSVASHDLQEPLRKIQAFGEMLTSRHGEALNEQGKDYLARMVNAAARMQDLVNDLLALSRVSRRERSLQMVDLNEVLGEVRSTLELQLEKLGGKLEGSNLPTLEADPTQMRELLQNLASNALKFHKEGVLPVVKVSAEPAREDGFIRLMVEDNGIGFDQKYADRIFGLFQRLHGRDEYEGTGIGLAICRKIVERHGGNIEALGNPGKGAKFVMTLPLRQAKGEGIT